jgi:hypothetical protein
VFLFLDEEVPRVERDVMKEEDNGVEVAPGWLFGRPEGFGVENDVSEKGKKKCNFCETGTGVLPRFLFGHHFLCNHYFFFILSFFCQMPLL